MELIQFMSKYVGRKFLAVVFLVVCATQGWVEDNTKFMWLCLAATAYFVAEGAVDVVRAIKEKETTPVDSQPPKKKKNKAVEQ